MNDISAQAMMQELNKLKTAHNALVTKAGGDLDKHGGILKQFASAIQSIDQRLRALEGRGAAPRAAMSPAPTRPQAVPVSPPLSATASPTGPVLVPPSGPAPQPPMSSGWADDEEEADFEEG